MRRKVLRWILVIIAAGLMLLGCMRLWQDLGKWKYPYGWSHSCDKALMLALLHYANDHAGAFPAGQATPEASLSLLYPKYLDNNVDYASEILRGKTAPKEVVRSKLSQGERLGPDSCGWHYVEGLSRDDDPQLALVWDKAGLGH